MPEDGDDARVEDLCVIEQASGSKEELHILAKKLLNPGSRANFREKPAVFSRRVKTQGAGRDCALLLHGGGGRGVSHAMFSMILCIF